MLIAGVSLLLSVFVLVSARLLYDRSHVFFLLCTAVERWFRRGAGVPTGGKSRSEKGGIGPGAEKVRGAAAP